MLHRSRFRPALSKRRRSRSALVTGRRQSVNDKARVSSINKRRMTPVPGESSLLPPKSGEAPGIERRWGSARVSTPGPRLGCSVPSRRGFRRGRDSNAREEGCLRTPGSRRGLPASHEAVEITLPFANDRMKPTRRRHGVPPPSGTDDASAPSVRRIRAPRFPRIAPRIERAGSSSCHHRTIERPASSDVSRETNHPWARRTTTLFPVDPASRSRLRAWLGDLSFPA